MTQHLRILSGALDDDGGEIVLRGVIDAATIHVLRIAEYQREAQPTSKLKDLMTALAKGKQVPDIDLGMRGGSFTEKDGAFLLQNEIYIVDGLQRTTAAQQLLRTGGKPHLGACIHFNTNEAWERDRFRILNVERKKLSPNILLRNMEHRASAIELLLRLSDDSQFILQKRICWGQNMRRDHLLRALTLLKVTSVLYQNIAPGLTGTNHEELALNLSKLTQRLGNRLMRKNILTFWDCLDECWHLRTVRYKDAAPFLKATFLLSVARLFADHENFWDDTELRIERSMQKKLATFAVTDPTITHLCGSTGTTRHVLYKLLCDHIDSGKRTHRLVPVKRRPNGVQNPPQNIDPGSLPDMDQRL